MLVYHSFTDPDLPEGSQFLGAAIVHADVEPAGPMVCHFLGCNPGGEVTFMAVPEAVARLIPGGYLGRLLTREEISELDVIIKRAMA